MSLAFALVLRGDDTQERKLYAIAARFAPASTAPSSSSLQHGRPLGIAVAKGIMDASGRAELVAVYANTFDGSVRVLVPGRHGSYHLGGVKSGTGMAGDIAHVELKDVDGDGIKEIVASFDGLRGPDSVWILKWNGRSLIDLTPTVDEGGVRTSALHDVTFADVDGDGKLELIGSNPYNSSEPSDIYTLRKGAFQKTGTLVFWKRYVGGVGAETFNVSDSGVRYVVTVVNGDEDGAHRVIDGSVLLNGEVIADADDIAVRPMTTTVHLRQSNAIEVKIKDPRQTLLVSVAPVTK